MDPISIADAIRCLYKASETIYEFIQDSQVIDTNILNLQRQVDGLARVLDTLSEVLQGKSLQDESLEKRQLWRSVAQALEACYPTVRELDDKLHNVRGNAGKKDFLMQAKKVFRLRLEQEEIDQLLATMQTHSINLQLALGIVQLMIAASAPETLAQELESRFERLERMMLMVDDRLATQSYPQYVPPAAENKVTAVRLDDNTKNLRRSAATIISSATTARGRSVSGMTRKPTLDYDQPAFDHFDPPDTAQRAFIEGSTTGSELGRPIDPSQRTHIHSWLQVSSFDSADVREGPSEEISTATPSDTLTSIFSGMSIASDTTASAPKLEIFIESSDEDELEVQVIKNFLTRAENKMQSKDFLAAQELLRRGLDESQHISEKRRVDLNLGDVQLQYGMCCFQCGKIEESEAIYSSLARREVKDVQDATRVLHALHGLASINLKKRNFEAATTHCRQALTGRRRTKTIGKRHADYFASLRLLALISWAKNDKVQAEAFSDMLPKEMNLDAQSFVDVLWTEYGISENTATLPDKINRTPSSDTQAKYVLERTVSGGSFTETDRSSVASPHPLVQQSPDIVGHHPRSPPMSLQTPEARSMDIGKEKRGPKAYEAEERRDWRPTNPRQNPQNPHRSNSISSGTPPAQTKTNVLTLPRVSDAQIMQTESSPRPMDNSVNTDSPPQSSNIGKKDPSQALLAAVKSRDVDLVRILCQGFGQKIKADVNVRGSFGCTPLMLAVTTANLEICTVLLAHRALVDLQDERGNTALVTAVLSAPLEVCQLLISHDADVNLVNDRGRSALMCAAHTSRWSLCELLIRSGAKLNLRDVEGRDAIALTTNAAIRELISQHLTSSEAKPNRKSVSNATGTGVVSGASSKPSALDQFDISIRGMVESVMSTGITIDQIQENKGFFESYHSQRLDNIVPTSILSEDEAAQAELRLLTNGFLQGTGHLDTSKAIFWAVKHSYQSVAVVLLHQFSVNLDERQKSEDVIAETVLHLAARKGLHEACVLLLDSGAAVNALNSNSRTPMGEAVQHGSFDTVKLLIDRGAWKDNAGAGTTPLTIAVRARRVDICRLLLQEGVDPNKSDKDGNFALWIAAGHTDLELYRLLVTSGADQTEVRAGKHTCFTRAADEGNDSLLTYIIETGYDVNQLDGAGFSALHYAARRGRTAMCKQLLSKGAKVDVRARDSDATPLMSAAGHSIASDKSVSVVKLLLESGADPNVVDKRGVTSLMWATSSTAEVLDLLISKGALVRTRSMRGSTALMFAASEGQLDACRKLVMWGADVNVINEVGETAITRASTKEIKKFLKANRW